MKKSLIYLAIAAFITPGFTSCSDDDGPDNGGKIPTETVSDGAYILTQGNYSMKLEGTLDVVDYKTNTLHSDLFVEANGRSMGATPQYGIAYGSKIYLAMYESNTIEVIDASSYKSLNQIKLSESGFNGTEPRSMVADKGKVYICMYDGYVSRLDTLSMKIDASVKVGPNPEIIGIHNNKLYVPNSDGMNYLNGYGKTASEISLDTFTVTKTFDVPLNPKQFLSVDGELYLLSLGDYLDVLGAIYKIGDDYTATKIAPATIVSAKDNIIYIIDFPFGGTPAYAIYDTESENLESVTFDEVPAPNAIGVDPVTGTIIIASHKDTGWESYSLPGFVYQYDSDRNFVKKYDTGTGPASIFFSSKEVAVK